VKGIGGDDECGKFPSLISFVKRLQAAEKYQSFNSGAGSAGREFYFLESISSVDYWEEMK